MVRQYRIHTDLDGSNNKIYDMTNGLIRFYQPSDLGIINSTNIWQSQGIGVMGNNNISHPDIDFKFETFGSSLEENYRIFNEFINIIYLFIFCYFFIILKNNHFIRIIQK